MVSEYCPYCENEVELKAELKPQRCPQCGMWITPCSLCENCKNECELEKLCNKLNQQ